VSENLRGLARKLRLTLSGNPCAAGLALGLAFDAVAESTLAHALIHAVLGGIPGPTGGLLISKLTFGRMRLVREMQLRASSPRWRTRPESGSVSESPTSASPEGSRDNRAGPKTKPPGRTGSTFAVDRPRGSSVAVFLADGVS
jgi:hypothetical protein